MNSRLLASDTLTSSGVASKLFSLVVASKLTGTENAIRALIMTGIVGVVLVVFLVFPYIAAVVSTDFTTFILRGRDFIILTRGIFTYLRLPFG